MNILISDFRDLLSKKESKIKESLDNLNFNHSDWESVIKVGRQLNEFFNEIEKLEEMDHGLKIDLRKRYEEKNIEFGVMRDKFRYISEEEWEWLND